MYMLDILTIVHSFSDTQTASRIRRTCRRLSALIPQAILYSKPNHYSEYEYRVGDKKHRLDGPAVESIDNCVYWYRGGLAHREYHPQSTRGFYREYAVDGLRHREAGPSVVYGHNETWYFRSKLHRKTGPACTIFGPIWYTLDKRHRLDGPTQWSIYAIRGVRHRISGPTTTGWEIDGVIIRVWLTVFFRRFTIFSKIYSIHKFISQYELVKNETVLCVC